PLVPRRRRVGDESLESFVVRRFGRELYERLAQPMVGGIYGADPALLSLGATMPRFVDFEATGGSVMRGLRRSVGGDPSERASGARDGLFVSLRAGNGRLIDALGARLGSRIRISCPVASLGNNEDRWSPRLEDGSRPHGDFDAVVVALPAHR